MTATNVLYIEDNPENRLLVKRMLEASGYRVTEAVDGPSGLRAAQESLPDLILLDISLPEMDGYDLARRFSEIADLQDVPILAITANVMKGDRERALAAGCDGYIPKPIDIDQLPSQVEGALRAARSRHAEPVEPAEELAPEIEMAEAPEIDWEKLFEPETAEAEERAFQAEEQLAPTSEVREAIRPPAEVEPVLTAERESAVLSELQSLADELGAETVILADRESVLAGVGRPDSELRAELAALAWEGLRASESIASLLVGSAGRCREQITESANVLVHARALDGGRVLLAAMPISVPLGATRLWMKRTARRLEEIVKEER